MNKAKEGEKHINNNRIIAFLRLILKIHKSTLKIATYLSSIFFSVWLFVLLLWLSFGSRGDYSGVVDIYLGLTITMSVAAIIIFWQSENNVKKKKSSLTDNVLLFIALIFVLSFITIKYQEIISALFFPITLIALLIRIWLRNNRNIINKVKKIFFGLGSFIYLILIFISLLGTSNVLIDKFNYLIKGVELLLNKGLVDVLMIILTFYLYLVFLIYYLIFINRRVLVKKEGSSAVQNRGIFTVLFLSGSSFIFFLLIFILSFTLNNVYLYNFIIKYLGWFIVPSLLYLHVNYLVYDFFEVKKFKRSSFLKKFKQFSGNKQ
jgi:hypothetical protein